MSPIKDFKLKYEALNKENSFSAGNTIKGVVTFTLTEETKIKCLYVKAKGDANAHWTESHGHAGHAGHAGHGGHAGHQNHASYSDHKRFYKAKDFLVAENKDGTILPKGDHQYQFKLKIPEGNIPPSFKGYHGKIVHVLQAKMSRSWHPSSSDRKELNFVSTFLTTEQTPQTGSVDKQVGTFSKGQVHLSATVNKRVCSPGETLHVTTKVTNKSSKKMRIKYSIEQKTVYRAMHHEKIETRNVCKLVGETIESDFEGNTSCPITVPVDTKLSIFNCQIINVEYYLKVYLDISFAVDPEVVLPLIIAAPGALAQHGHHGFPNTVGGPSTSDFPPAVPGPYPGPAAPPNAYSYPSGPYPYPSVPGGGFYNPVPNYTPPQPAPYGYPTAPYMPYPVPPQANPQFPQNQAPPPYMSVYPPPQSGTDMDKKTPL